MVLLNTWRTDSDSPVFGVKIAITMQGFDIEDNPRGWLRCRPGSKRK